MLLIINTRSRGGGQGTRPLASIAHKFCQMCPKCSMLKWLNLFSKMSSKQTHTASKFALNFYWACPLDTKTASPGLARKTEIRRSCQTLALKCFCIRSLLPWNLVELWTTSLTAVATCVPFALTLQLLYDTNHSTSNHDVCITVLFTNTSIALSTQL